MSTVQLLIITDDLVLYRPKKKNVFTLNILKSSESSELKIIRVKSELYPLKRTTRESWN